MTRKKSDGTDSGGPSFERALERLEEIVAQMEDGTLGLDDMMARFEEGRKLIRFCNERLNEVEKKVELLLDKDGEPQTEPFAETGGPDEPGAEKGERE